jgi:hypothetical protein
MKPNAEDLVRCDRVGIYDRYGVWRYVPLQGPAYGDLWLTADGHLGYSRVNWMNGISWDTTVSEVKDVSRVGAGIYAWCSELRHTVSLEADFAGQRYLIYFTGITAFMSRADRLISSIPGVQHAGALLVGTKSTYQNRGAKARGKEALEVWLKVLEGSCAASDLPRLARSAENQRAGA